MQYYLNKLISHLPRIIAGLLILNVFGFDLFSNQTVFLLDYVPTPVRVWNWSSYLSIPWIWVMHDGLLYMLWHIWWSKVYLVSIVIVTLIVWYRWWQYIITDLSDPTLKQSELSYLPLLMMIMMVCNPVFSSRMQTQPWVWLGIVLLWWWWYRLVRCWQDSSIRDGVIIGTLWWCAMMSMNHASFMIALLLWVLWITRIRSVRIWKVIGVIIGMVWLINLNWIIAWILGQNQIIQWATTFSQSNLQEFMTFSHSWLGPVMTSVLWYGFWGEKYSSASAPTWINSRWWIAWLMVIYIAWYGWYQQLVHSRRDHSKLWMMMTVMIISVILWVGIASDTLAPVIQRWYDHIPWYRGLREPHKWIGLYMMILLPLVWYGWIYLDRYVTRFMSRTRYVILMIGVLLAWAPWVIRQMYLRYDMTDYPSSYSKTRDILMQQPWSGSRIQLPWHSYHRCQWTNKVIANTLNLYMKPVSVIVSDNIEVWQLYTNSTDVRSRAIEAFIADKDLSHLSGYNIAWVMYMPQCADFQNYAWITTHSWFQLIWDLWDVQLYQIKQ